MPLPVSLNQKLDQSFGQDNTGSLYVMKVIHLLYKNRILLSYKCILIWWLLSVKFLNQRSGWNIIDASHSDAMNIITLCNNNSFKSLIKTIGFL